MACCPDISSLLFAINHPASNPINAPAITSAISIEYKGSFF
jgi:hypothetical protein